MYLSIRESAKLANRSQSWIRTKLKRWAVDGQAVQDEKGRWAINQQAILAEAGSRIDKIERKGATAFEAQKSHENDAFCDFLQEQVRLQKETIKQLHEENISYRSEVRKLNEEIKALLQNKSGSRLSRWFRI